MGKELTSDWGFSCVIETPSGNILFDTGAKSDILLDNMRKLNIDPLKIIKIVLSHEHWDHVGGLDGLVSAGVHAVVFRLANISSRKETVIVMEEPIKIGNGAYTTGRIEGKIPEQSLVLQGKKGLYVLTGCSHPGVSLILQKAATFGSLQGLIGGFHGFNEFSVIKNLSIICPCHCTQHKKEIFALFPKSSMLGGVGKILEL